MNKEPIFDDGDIRPYVALAGVALSCGAGIVYLSGSIMGLWAGDSPIWAAPLLLVIVAVLMGDK